MVRLYAISGDSLREAIRMFTEMFLDREPPSQSVMLAATQRLRDHRQFDVPHTQARGSVGLPIALQEDILEYFQREPRASMREAREVDLHRNLYYQQDSAPPHYGRQVPTRVLDRKVR